MKKKSIIITSIAALALLCVGAVAADHEMAPPPRPDGPFRDLIMGQVGRIMVLRSEINLTPDQKSKIHEILMSHRVDGAQAIAAVIEKAQALRHDATAEQPDESAIRAAASDLGKAIGDAAVLASKVRTEVNPVLTADQRKLVDDFRDQSATGVSRWLKTMLDRAKTPPADGPRTGPEAGTGY